MVIPKQQLLKGAAIAKKFSPLRIKLVLICFGLIGLICLVMFIYLGNVYVDPNYLNVGIYLNKSYSRATTAKIIEVEKEYQETVNEVNKNNAEDWSSHTFDPSTYTGTGKLSESRFSTAKGYIENFVSVNNDLLAYTSSYCKVNVGSTSFDGLLYMAMCNDESYAWLRDDKQTVSSAFPSAIVDIDGENYLGQFEKLNIGTIFTSPNAYNLSGGSYYSNTAWLHNGSYGSNAYDSDQGPSTSAFNEYNHGKIVSNRSSEVSIITDNKHAIDKIAKDEAISNHIIATGTGSGSRYYNSTIANGGDRWNIQDSASVFALNMDEYLPKYAEAYKEIYGKDAGKYEILCFAQMQHWYGSGYDCFKDYGASGISSHYTKPYAWSVFIQGICDDSSLAIIQDAVNTALSSGTDLPATSTDSELVQNVIANVNSIGVKYPDGSAFKSSTDICSGQGRSEFINYLYNYMFLETLYSEGGSTEQ